MMNVKEPENMTYGGPGTGKTETVLQIARKTGRNIMMVDIAGLRSKFDFSDS